MVSYSKSWRLSSGILQNNPFGSYAPLLFAQAGKECQYSYREYDSPFVPTRSGFSRGVVPCFRNLRYCASTVLGATRQIRASTDPEFRCTIPAQYWFMDHWGRRRSTILGGLGMAACMITLGSINASGTHSAFGKWLSVAVIYCFISMYDLLCRTILLNYHD